MGLGKTLQVISFIDILLMNTEAHTVLAIVPVSNPSVERNPVIFGAHIHVPQTHYFSLFLLIKGEHASKLAVRV